MNTKKALRNYWLAHRLLLSEPQKNLFSHQIQELLVNEFPLHKAEYIHVFLPVHSQCEVRTWAIIQYIQEKLPMVQLCAPRVTDSKNKRMESISIERQTIYVKNKWGIEEPETGALIQPSDIDIVLLPLILFDLKGHRLGYGGGFYDRYLPLCDKATKIGLSFFEPIESIPEINEYDVPMDYCITPNKIHHF